MLPADWVKRWEEQRTGFHLDTVNPLLRRHADSVFAKGSRVLVPLCGKSRDLLWLESRGHAVVGVEVARRAIDDFLHEHQRPADWSAAAGLAVCRSGAIELWCADLFDLTGELVCADAVYDRAALVAVTPPERGRYVQQLARLAPSSPKLLIGLDYDQRQMQGPPFAVATKEVREMWPDHQTEVLATAEALAENPAMKKRGLTWLHEYCVRLLPTS